MGSMRGIFVVTVFALVITGLAGSASAKGKKAKTPAAPKVVNACGCYTDPTGKCFCGRGGKCECPGECEPKGCEEKRAKQMQKDIAAETKKAADDDRKERQSEGKPGVGSKDETKPRRKPVDKDGVGQ